MFIVITYCRGDRPQTPVSGLTTTIIRIWFGIITYLSIVYIRLLQITFSNILTFINIYHILHFQDTSKRRYIVERVFGTLKEHYDMARASCLGTLKVQGESLKSARSKKMRILQRS